MARTLRPTDLLLAMVEGSDQMAGDILRAAGLDGLRLREDLRKASDTAGPGTLGIDLDAVRSQVEDTFGDGALARAARKPKGHVPFTGAALLRASGIDRGVVEAGIAERRTA